ncbi:hypothetical protein CR513_51776, partial [Mucuna pruriens]
MVVELTLRWPPSWIADVVNTIGPLFIGLLDCKARTAETTLAWPRWSRSGRDDFISAETLLLTLECSLSESWVSQSASKENEGETPKTHSFASSLNGNLRNPKIHSVIGRVIHSLSENQVWSLSGFMTLGSKTFPPPLSLVATFTFSHLISEKLDSKNYLWCQQVELVLKGHHLHHYLEQQDQLLLSWLQLSILQDMLTHVIGCKSLWQLWDKIHTYFNLHINAKARQLRIKLCNTSLDNHIVFEYLIRIQALVGALITISDVFDPLFVNEVETLLLAHEACMDKFKKKDVVSINIVEPSPNAPCSQAQTHVAQVSVVDQYVAPHSTNTNNTQSGWFGHKGCVGTHGGCGRYSRIHCQVCHKYGQEASNCYHHFEENYVPINTYHCQPHGFPTLNNQYVRPAPSSFVPSMPSHLTTPASPHTMMATIDPYSSTNHWYLNSSASHDVTNGLNIQSASVTKCLPLANSKIPLFLNNILFVLLITKNILSVHQFTKDYFVYFEFHASFCLVKSQDTYELLLKDFVVIVPSLSFYTWHFGLSHPNVDAQCIVFKHCNFPPLNKKANDFCSSCCLGKAHLLPSTISTTVYNKSLELIYMIYGNPLHFY